MSSLSPLVAVLSQKGGSGKTTLALALAVAHERAGGRAAVIDLDPQGSAVTWRRLRIAPSPTVVATHPNRLAASLQDVRHAGASLVVADTPPREAGGAAAIARLADLVLIPSRPATLDLASVPPTLAVCEGRNAAVILNACPTRGSWISEATETVRFLGVALCPVTLGIRVVHARAITAGLTAQEAEPNSLAAAEVANLYQWIMEKIT